MFEALCVIGIVFIIYKLTTTEDLTIIVKVKDDIVLNYTTSKGDDE